MDSGRVTRALAKSYAKSGKRLRMSITSKHASLREFMECEYDCSKLVEEKSLAVFIFKSTPSVRGRTNEVVWTKALCDTPIEYALQLAKAYHGFAEGIRKHLKRSIKDYIPCVMGKKLPETFTNIETLYEKNKGRVSSFEFTNACILYVEEVNGHLTSLADTLYEYEKTSSLITYYLDHFKVPSSGFLPASKFIDVIYMATEENSRRSFVDYNLKCQQGHAFNEKTMDKRTVALMENEVCENCGTPVYHDIVVRLLSRTEYPSDNTKTTNRIGKVALNDDGVFDEESLPKVMAELTRNVASLVKSSVPVIISSKATLMFKKGIEEGKPKGMLECYKQVSLSKVMREVERAVMSSLKVSMEWNKKPLAAEGGGDDAEEEDDVKEIEVPPSQKKANRGTVNFLVSRRMNPLPVRIKGKYYEADKTEWQLITIRSMFDSVHADNKVYRSDCKAKREQFPIDLNTVGVCSENAYTPHSTNEDYMACRHAVVSAIRPWLASNEKMMRNYDFCSIRNPREVSDMDRCDPEEILSKRVNGEYVRTNGKYAKLQKYSNFEVFVMNATEKAIVPYASREELSQPLVKATSGVGGVEAIVERSCGMNKLTSKGVVNPERTTLESLDRLISRNNGAVFFNNIAFVDNYIKYLRGKRDDLSLKEEDLVRLERAFEDFARSQEEKKDKEYCHLDHIVARGIDPTFPLVHMVYTLFFNNHTSASHNLPVLPMSVYDEISQAVKVMEMKRPDAWKKEYLQNREDLALGVFRFGLHRHGYLAKDVYVPPFFAALVKPEDAPHGVDEETMTVRSSLLDPKVEMVKRRRREEETNRRRAVNTVSSPRLPPSLVDEDDSDIELISEIDGNDRIVIDTIELEKEKNEMDERKKIEILKKTIARNMGGSLLERHYKANLEKTTKEVTEFCESDGEAESKLRGENTTFKRMESEISRANVESVIENELRKMDKGRLNVFSQMSVPSVLLCGKVKEPSVLSVPKDIRDELERKKQEAKKKREWREAKRRMVVEEEVVNVTNNNISIDTPAGVIEVNIGGQMPAVEKREEKAVTISKQIGQDKKKDSEVADKRNSAAGLPALETELSEEEEEEEEESPFAVVREMEQNRRTKNRGGGMEERQQENDTVVSGTVMNTDMETEENETIEIDKGTNNPPLDINVSSVIYDPDIDINDLITSITNQPIDEQQFHYYGNDSGTLDGFVAATVQQLIIPEDSQQVMTQKTAQVSSCFSSKRNLEEEEEEDAPAKFTLTKRQRVSSSSSSSSLSSSNGDPSSLYKHCDETESEKKKRRRREEKKRRRRHEMKLVAEEADENKNVSEKEMKRQDRERKEKKLLKKRKKKVADKRASDTELSEEEEEESPSAVIEEMEKNRRTKDRGVEMEDHQQQENDTAVSGTVMNTDMETEEKETMYHDLEETDKGTNNPPLGINLSSVIYDMPDIDDLIASITDQPIDEQQFHYYGNDFETLDGFVAATVQQLITPEDGQQIMTQKTAQVSSCLSYNMNIEEEGEEDAPAEFSLTTQQHVSSSSFPSSSSSSSNGDSSSKHCNETEAGKKKRRRREEKERRRRHEMKLVAEEEADENTNVSEKEMKRQDRDRKEKTLLKKRKRLRIGQDESTAPSTSYAPLMRSRVVSPPAPFPASNKKRSIFDVAGFDYLYSESD